MTEYITAAKTANMRNAAPMGEAFRERSLLISIMEIPIKEMAIPRYPVKGNFSPRVIRAAIGLKTGMVAMITAAMVGVDSLSPKFSPMK